MKKIGVKVKKLHKDAKTPFYAYESAAACDLHSIEDIEVKPGEIIKVGTGIATEIEPGYFLRIMERSGLGSKGIHCLAGVIDSDYRGEIKVVIQNLSKEIFSIKSGDRIAQAAILPCFQADFEEVEELSETQRGEKGFNSTGKS